MEAELSLPPAPKRSTPGTQRTRRISTKTWIISGLALVLIAGAAVAAVLTHPSISVEGPETLTAQVAPELELVVEHPASISSRDVTALVNGDAVDTADIDVDPSGRITIQAPRLDDGEHEAKVTVRGAGLTLRTLRASWTFTVDTTAPKLRVTAPVARPTAKASAYVPVGTIAVTKLPLAVRVDSEPGAVLELASTAPEVERVRVDAASEAKLEGAITLPDGAQELIIRTFDAAGNSTERRQRVLVDTSGPKLTTTIPRTTKQAALNLPVTIADPHGATLTVKLNGVVVEDAVQVLSATKAPAGVKAAAGGDGAGGAAEVSDAAAGEAPAGADDGDSSDREDAPIAAKLRVVLPEGAYEGRNKLELIATDSLGSTTVRTQQLVVNSSEQLSMVRGLRAGAVGGDVVELQQALIEEGAATKAQLTQELQSKRFGPATRTAVKAYQSTQGIGPDGVAGAQTVAALTLRIVIDLSDHTLTLFSRGDVVKTYGVAVGAPEFPTPTGEFAIQSKQKDPTWTPPDSDWAKDAEVTPPGPDNPLGTRWMAFDGTVGIHGTNNAASIGYSQSHGCVRMRIPDVEDLFERVSIGTKVVVVA